MMMAGIVQKGTSWEVKTNDRVRFWVIINIIATALVIAFEMVPLLERTASNYTRLPIWGAWLVTFFLMPKKELNLLGQKFFGWWVAYVIWLFLMFLIGHSNQPMLYFLAKIPLYSIPIMLVLITKCYRPNEILVLWLIILAIFLYCLVDNIQMGEAEHEIYNRMHEYSEDSTWATNVGGTTHILQCLFMCPIFWLIIQNTEYKIIKIAFLLCLVATTYYMMFINNRTTALLIWLYMAGMFILNIRGKYRNRPMGNMIVTSIIMLVFVAVFARPILELLMSIFSESSRMTNRLGELLSFSESQSVDTSGESLQARYLLYMRSVKTFFSGPESFLFGIGEDVHGLDIMSLLAEGAIGYHSEFFDLAAKYGIIGIVLVYGSLKGMFNYMRSLCTTNKEITMLNVILMGFVIYSFLNNTFKDSTFIVIFLFLPLTIMLLNYKKL